MFFEPLKETHIIESAPHLMPSQLDVVAGDLLKRQVRRLRSQLVGLYRPKTQPSRLSLKLLEDCEYFVGKMSSLNLYDSWPEMAEYIGDGTHVITEILNKPMK